MPDYDPDSIPVLDDVIEDNGSSTHPIGGENSAITTETINAELSKESNAELKEENLDLFAAEPVELLDVELLDIVETEIVTDPPLPDNTTTEDDTEGDTELYITDIDTLDESIVDQQITASRDDETSSDTTAIVFDATDNTTDDAVDAVNEDDFSALAPEAVVAEPIEPESVESALIDYHGEQGSTENVATAPDFKENETLETAKPTSDESLPPQEADETTPVQEVYQISLQPLVDDIVKQLMPDIEQQLRFLVQQALQDKLPEEIFIKED